MEKFKFLPKEKLEKIPKEAGVYCFSNKDEILYIGKAGNLRERIKNHFQNPSFKDHLFLDKVKKIGYLKTGSEIEALILEAKLIKKYQPKFNIIWRDSKNYFFVAITKEDFPKVFWTHQKKLKAKSSKLKAKFVGPFVDGKALKKTLYLLRKIFPYYSAKTHPKKKCPWCHLNLCPGPHPDKKEYQKNIKNLIEILKGKRKGVLKELKKEMEKSALKKEFEMAAKIRDQILALEKIFEHSKILEKETENKNQWEKIEESLKEILKLKKVSRIEAFDVSQIHGNFAVGSMVTFVEGVAEKKFYRRFKIKFTKKPSDLDMIEEVLERRLKHKEWGVPDIILIDGGKAHLKVGERIKEKLKIKNFSIISLAKPEKKIYIEGKKQPLFLKNLNKDLAHFILKLDKEAHRFAISYHRNLRKKSLFDIKNK
jgi:excinuclease ABC subunit C